jgi:hypothetical protein
MTDQDIKNTFQQLAKPMDYQWRLKSTTRQKGADKLYPVGTKGQFLAYIDARDVYNRLDEVVGCQAWDSDWEVVDAARMAVKATITLYIGDRIISKSDVGYPNGTQDEEPLKSAVSDAIKRTAVQFGIGRFLYDLDPKWVEIDSYGKPLQPLDGGSTKTEATPSDSAPARPTTPARPATATRAATPARTPVPLCPICGGPMWDNRENKRNPKAPDFKCKDRECDGAIWPEKNNPKEDHQMMSLEQEAQELFPGARDVDDAEAASLYASQPH